jgi:hypothetical protein
VNPTTPIAAFFAYPATPGSIGQTIKSALESLRSDKSARRVEGWEENDIAGRFIAHPILQKLDSVDFLLADITRLNFNVVFEIGYAIGRQKRVILVRNRSLTTSDALVREIGLFDTLGYSEYSQTSELVAIVADVTDLSPIPLTPYQISRGSPVYVVTPRVKTDAEVRVLSRLKKARLQFRTFDPEEQGRLAALEAIENVARSHGVIVSLLPRDRVDAEVHNYRSAFVAGLAMAMERSLLFLQEGDDPVPLDYRDLVKSFRFPTQIDEYVADFAASIGERFQATSVPLSAEPQTLLEQLNLGASAAENELQDLGNYYLETDEFRRALRGEVRIITGRKGAGKTALFSQLRDKTRRDRSKLVLDLKPEGFQLLKFRDRVLNYLEEGSREHTITAFWEYLLLLEMCQKLLEKDKVVHLRDSRLYQPYREMSEAYFAGEDIAEGDFSERMLALTQRIADDFDAAHPLRDGELRMSSGQVTELLHRHDVSVLRNRVAEYLTFKNGVWLLFDNLDKGWPAQGVTAQDVLTLRSLIDAIGKIEHAMQKREIECHGVIFIRNDVYELLVDNSPDRGKIASVALDWTDADLLREVLRRRFAYGGVGEGVSFEEIWRQIAVTHIRGEESSQYLIDRSLMRPRALIELVRFCRSHAVNLRHARIEVADIDHGEEAYSSALLENVNYEVRDVYPLAGDLLYEFVGASELQVGTELKVMLESKVGDRWQTLFDLLLWYGFLGVVRESGETSYVYSVKYDMKRLRALAFKNDLASTMFRINPAFWRALEILH